MMMMIVKAFRSERGLVGNRFASNDSQLHASSILSYRIRIPINSKAIKVKARQLQLQGILIQVEKHLKRLGQIGAKVDRGEGKVSTSHTPLCACCEDDSRVARGTESVQKQEKQQNPITTAVGGD